MSKLHIKKTRNFKQIQRCIFILFLTFTSIVSVSAQTKYNKAEGSIITVSGTSTFKNWEMTSSQMSSEVEFKLDKAGNLTHLNSLTFKLEVKTLSSDNRSLDKNAHDALKIDTHPFISFRSVSSKILHNTDDSYTISVKGMLTIAGVTKEKNIEIACVRRPNGRLSCTGKTKILMTDFGVKPPIFMMGVMKTGDEITISYRMNYKP